MYSHIHTYMYDTYSTRWSAGARGPQPTSFSHAHESCSMTTLSNVCSRVFRVCVCVCVCVCHVRVSPSRSVSVLVLTDGTLCLYFKCIETHSMFRVGHDRSRNRRNNLLWSEIGRTGLNGIQVLDDCGLLSLLERSCPSRKAQLHAGYGLHRSHVAGFHAAAHYEASALLAPLRIVCHCSWQQSRVSGD